VEIKAGERIAQYKDAWGLDSTQIAAYQKCFAMLNIDKNEVVEVDEMLVSLHNKSH
jgi:hypothetical protein